MKKLLEKSKLGLKKAKKVIAGISAAFTFGMLSAMPASAATTINNNATTASVIGGILDIIFQIAFYLGVVIAVIGVVSFIMSFKDDNAESQSRGIRLALVGTALIGIRLLIKMTGLIS